MRSLLAILSLVLMAATADAAERNLYNQVKDMGTIRIFIKEVKDEIPSGGADIRVFRDVLTAAFAARNDMRFVSVKKENDADFVISCTLKKYLFRKEVPPRFFSAWAAVADATAPKSSGKISVDYLIERPRTGIVVSSFDNFTTEERRPRDDMAGKAGFRYTAEKNAHRFIYRAFSRPKKKL